MNLNRFKKGFTKTNPERGLHTLPGVHRPDRAGDETSTVRVKGRYIPSGTDNTGKVFGILSFTVACLCTVLFPLSFFAGKDADLSPLAVFVMGLFLVHGFAIFADSLRHSESIWSRRGIKLFWLSSLVWIMIGWIIS